MQSQDKGLSLTLNESPLRFLKNAVSNLLSGASTAVLAIVLPYVLVKHFDPAAFGLWVLMLQLGGYANYLNLGIQTAVGRYVAEALSLGNDHRIGAIASAGTQFLTILALFGAIALVCTAIFFDRIFTQVLPSLIPVARTSVLWIGGAFLLALPASATLGVFIGVQKNEVPAYIAIGSRVAVGAGTAWIAATTHDLVSTSIAFFATSLADLIFRYWIYVRSFPRWPIRMLSLDRALSVDLARYCTSLAVWSVSMLLVNGVSITLVGVLDFKNLAYFGVAVSLVTFLVGIQQSVFSPLIQIFAGLHTRGDDPKSMRLLMLSSAVCSALLVLVSLILYGFGKILLLNWVGEVYSSNAFPILMVLVLGNIIRYSATPYALWLIATGQQRKVLLTPFVEGLVNLAVSVAAGYQFGAIGVAWGVVVGGITGIAANFLFNIPRTLGNEFSRLEYGLQSLLYPGAVWFACAVAGMGLESAGMPHVWVFSILLAIPMFYLTHVIRKILNSNFKM